MSIYIVTKWVLHRWDNDKVLKFEEKNIKNMGPSNLNQILHGLNNEI